MRRLHVDEARQRQTAAERRFRGHRIRGGLDELGDLDAPPKRNGKKESTTAASASASVPTGKVCTQNVDTSSSTKASGASATAPLLSSSMEVSTTVFGVDWSEWIEVKRILFDMEASVEKKRTALNKVRVWHIRARKERVLPPYVEATEVLLDAVLQDESDALAESPQRMCYGAAISRSVHIMTGSFATGQADTYRKRAQEIGFPEEAVEVRQRVAHGALPLTSELRWVCGLVLQFLFTEYWLEQERQLHFMQHEEKKISVKTQSETMSKMEERGPVVSSKNQKGKRTQKSVAADAVVAGQPSEPPPSVSIEEMKALLADLEREEEDDSAAPSMTATTVNPHTSLEDDKECEKTKSNVTATKPVHAVEKGVCLNGWLLS